MVAHLNINTLFRMSIQLGNVIWIKHPIFFPWNFKIKFGWFPTVFFVSSINNTLGVQFFFWKKIHEVDQLLLSAPLSIQLSWFLLVAAVECKEQNNELLLLPVSLPEVFVS